jgi:2-polyprenyl-3-methyl-5-hydroxy-6-metoxy-1,4-benzoquinol methylase
MEVGAGFGTFCEEVKRLNIFRRVIAIEPTPDLAQTCREKGLEVIEKPIEQVRPDKGDQVDVIATFEVIEHLFSPREFLRGCASVLEPGGLIIITCPNVKGFDLVTLQVLSDTVDVEHLNYFNPGSLSSLLRESGFQVLEAVTPGKLDAELVRKKALSGEFSLEQHPFLRQILIEEWDRVGDSFQQFLVSNQLSSHMWLIGRKVKLTGG